MRPLRQVIGLGLIHQQKERVEIADGGTLVYAVEIRIGDAALVQCAYPRARACAQLVHIAEEDGLCGAGFGTGRREAVLLPVVAERALPRTPVLTVQIDLGYLTIKIADKQYIRIDCERACDLMQGLEQPLGEHYATTSAAQQAELRKVEAELAALEAAQP